MPEHDRLPVQPSSTRPGDGGCQDPSRVDGIGTDALGATEEAGRELVAEVARLMPAGPTRLVRVPWVEEVEHLDDDLVRIRARATVAHGREWLVETFLPDLLKERGEGVIVHGPIVWHIDESAQREFARTLGLRERTP
jgi:hypothetical protein